MALLETWRKLAYETEMNQNQATEFWNSYFVQEKAIYEQILATPDAPVSGLWKECVIAGNTEKRNAGLLCESISVPHF